MHNENIWRTPHSQCHLSYVVVNLQYIDALLISSGIRIQFLDTMHDTPGESKYIFNSLTCPYAVVVNVDSGEDTVDVYIGHVGDGPY